MGEENNWPAFLLERAAYRFRGVGVHWANRLAQQHYPPPGFPINAIRTGKTGSECGLGTYGITEIKMRRRVIAQLGIENSAKSAEFEGRTCSFNIAMEWVAENLGIDTVQQDAPSRLAWSVYQWASSDPGRVSKFYELYLGRRYRPDKDDDDDGFDPAENLSIGGEDIGLPRQPMLPDTLPADSDRSGRELEVADSDELAGFAIGTPAETDS
jgi:hypothetical protein